MTSQDVLVLITKTCECINLYGKSHIKYVIKLRILNHKSLCKREERMSERRCDNWSRGHGEAIAIWSPEGTEKAVAATPVPLPGKSHGRRSLVGCGPWGLEESDTTERLHFHFSLSYIGEGNGNPLQCSCLENPRDGGAWWAAVSGVAQSRTWLKRLSSGSNVSSCFSFTRFLRWKLRLMTLDLSAFFI